MLKEMDQHLCTLEVFLTTLPVNWLTLPLTFPHSGNTDSYMLSQTLN